MDKVESYVKLFKIKNHCNTFNKILIHNFISYYINDDGTIIITKKIYQELYNLIIKIIVNDETYEKENIILFFKVEDLEIFKLNEVVFYKNFFEELGIHVSVLETKNLNYNIISKIIFEIYLYGTTLDTLEKYIEYNDNLTKCNKLYVKILSKYIINQSNNTCYDFSATSYKLLILGHLFSLDFLDQKHIIVENPDFMFARITLELCKDKKHLSNTHIINIFNDLKEQYIIPSTPMFYNALRKNINLLSSCFLINVEDNIDSIADFMKKVIKILKYNSGIGVMLNKIRAKNRPVMNGLTYSNGIMNYIDILSFYSNQYKNHKRQRSSNININLTIDHPDILEFLKLKLNTNSKDHLHYNYLFQTVIIPDEFIYRYLTNQDWYLISPEQTFNGKHLYDVHGENYSALYNMMVNDPKIEKIKIPSYILMSEIVNCMIATGGPNILFKDVVNATSNQQHKGIIQGTNLCTEILEYCDDQETGCCNIASLNLKKFVKYNETSNMKIFDFVLFKDKICRIVELLNETIDISYYSENTCQTSNIKNRPIAVGIQGLANLYYELGISYLEGINLYKNIMECLYYYALKTSNDIIKYNPMYAKQKLYDNKFSFELYEKYQKQKINKLDALNLKKMSEQINLNNYQPQYIKKVLWDNLKLSIEKYGLANSLLIALMPTSLSSGIYNNSESFEPYSYNIYKKTFSKYDIILYNKYLVEDLLKTYPDYLNETNIIDVLQKCNGEIDKLPEFVKNKEELKRKHITLYDISSNDYVKYHTRIDPFIDQGISFNIYEKNNSQINITKMILDLWLQGKKTTYYYRTKLNVEPLVFNEQFLSQIKSKNSFKNVCTDTVCTACT